MFPSLFLQDVRSTVPLYLKILVLCPVTLSMVTSLLGKNLALRLACFKMIKNGLQALSEVLPVHQREG